MVDVGRREIKAIVEIQPHGSVSMVAATKTEEETADEIPETVNEDAIPINSISIMQIPDEEEFSVSQLILQWFI